GRWLITKHDLLAAQAIDYKLRSTSAFAPLSIAEGRLPAGKLAAAYSARLRAEGGIPFYDWSIAGGKLPDGIVLDSFSGEIHGTPTQAGKFDFTVRLRDYDEAGQGVNQPMTLEISE
ncbi:MAG TPA: Ig domain-containing protein, partial [Pirellulales bacterium]|nr:Ig domain-containing protein [Pirellulales bacterium]